FSASAASANFVVFVCPAVPILPNRTVRMLPSTVPSQNLLDPPSVQVMRAIIQFPNGLDLVTDTDNDGNLLTVMRGFTPLTCGVATTNGASDPRQIAQPPGGRLAVRVVR